MNVEHTRKVMKLAGEALDLGPTQQRRFLQEQTENNPALYRDVLSLMQAYDQTLDFLDAPFFQGNPGHEPDCLQLLEKPARKEEPVPNSLGPYRVSRKLGSGGMGHVYLASLANSDKSFAIKVLKQGAVPGADACLERECRVLSSLRHPNIVRYLGAENLADYGNCLFTEYIDGPTITQYCQNERLPLRMRLKLLADVCRGVAYLHKKGWLHGDLKPANILIKLNNGTPIPKIIDFGIAFKPGELERPMMGSPAYLSPEALMAAADGSPIDRRSDVFSLGILFRQLLLGEDASISSNPCEVRQEPAVAFSSFTHSQKMDIAWCLNTSVTQLAQFFQGPASAIMMKACAVERDRRYASVPALLSSLERFLGKRKPRLSMNWMKQPFSMPLAGALC